MSDWTDQPADLRALLDEARSDGPSRERLDRVGTALTAQLGGGFASTAADVAGAADVPVPRGAARPAVTSTTLVIRAATGGVIAVVAWLLIAREPVAPRPDASASPPSSEASSLDESEPAVESSPPPPAAVDSALPAPSAREISTTTIVPGAPAPPPPPALGRRETAERDPEVEAATTELGTADPGSTLREEIALLERAMAARDAGDPEGARAVLARHRARFPSGILTPERERLLGELSSAPVAPEAGTPDPASPP